MVVGVTASENLAGYIGEVGADCLSHGFDGQCIDEERDLKRRARRPGAPGAAAGSLQEHGVKGGGKGIPEFCP